MKKIAKTISALLVSLCIMSTMLAGITLPAAAASGTTGDCTWALDGTVLTISGNGAMANYEYSEAAPWGIDITGVVIEDGVTSIGYCAFYNCAKITSITIPNSVTSIGQDAFYNCAKLTNISIPDSVTSIGQGAFYSCDALASITIPDSVISLGNSVFNKCYNLASVVIGNGVKVIDDSTFEDCSKLTNIVIGQAVTSIDQFAFYGCKSLTCIIIPSSVTSIGWQAFNSCENLKAICYAGTEDEWEAISKGANAIPDTAKVYFNHSSHNYKSEVIAPTFTTQGYTTHTCSVCGHNYKDNYTAILNSVQNMQIISTDTSITATWDAPTGVTKYILYVKNEAGETIITRSLDASRTTATLSWPNELEWDKTYTIGIRAKTSKWLDTVWKDAALTVAGRIVDVKTQSVGRTIKVDWRAYEGATQYYVYVYKKGEYPTAFSAIEVNGKNSVSIINAIYAEVDYEVRVIATKGVTKMKTIDAIPVAARLNVYNPDVFIERGITPTSVGIAWDEIRGVDKCWAYLTPVNGGETIIRETTRGIVGVYNLTPNTEYTVQLQARIVDADGIAHYSGMSDVLGTITTSDWENISFTAKKTEGGAQLTWTPPANVYEYIIYRSVDGGKTYKELAIIVDAEASSYVDAKGKDGYIYAIVTKLKDDFVATKSKLIKSEAI